MPYLIKQIQGEIHNLVEGGCVLVTNINAEIGVEDYIQVNDFIAFTQNFSKAIEVTQLPTMVTYGLKNNTTFTEVEISYPLT